MAASQVVKVIFDGKDQTSKAISSLKGNLNQADKAVGQIKKSLGGMTTAIGLAAGAAGFGLLTKNALQVADALAKTSSKLGVASDELFRFQTMAELSGVSTETANMALQRFTRRTAEAAMGTGEAKAALMELGIAADELQKLPLAERMKVLADAFVGVEDESDQLRIAFKLFDSEGAAMVNMLKNGSAGLEEMEAQLGNLGRGMDDSLGNIEDFNDAVTILQARVNAAMIEGIGRAAPEFERLTAQIEALVIPLTTGLLNGLQWLLDNLETVTAVVKGFAAAWALLKFGQLVVGLGQLASALGVVKVAMIALRAAMGPIGVVLSAVSAAAVYFKDDLEDLGSEMGLFQKDAKGATGETEDLENAIDQLQEVVVSVEKKPLPDLRQEVVALSKEERQAAVETLELKEALEKLREKAIAPQRDLDQFIKKMAILRKEMEENGDESGELAKTMEALIREFSGVESEAEKVRREIEKVKTAMEEAAKAGLEGTEAYEDLERQLNALGGELVDAIRETSDLTDNQRELLESATALERGIADLNQDLADLEGLYNSGAIDAEQYGRAVRGVRDEINDLNNANLNDFQSAIADAFDSSPIGEFMGAIEALGGATGPLGDLLGKFTTLRGAITDCFGTGQVNSFGNAIKALYTGDGSAIGAFGGAINSLTNALGAFFGGAEGRFGSFKTSVIQILNELASAAIASVGINFLKNLIPGLAYGGAVEGFAVGGRVSGPGGPREDKVPAMLSAGEYVIQSSSVSKFGKGFFDALNAGKLPGFSLGGFITDWLAGLYAYGGPGYSIDNPNWSSYLLDLYEALSQVDPRDDPLEAYDAAAEIIVNRIAKAISDAYAMTDDRFGTQIASAGSVGDVITRVLGPLGGLTTQGFLNEFDVLNRDSTIDGIRNGFFDALVGLVRGVQIAPANFNMDDLYGTLFNRSNAVANGSLYVQPRQFGGPVSQGQSTLVGEDGPELFIPDRNGRVAPISNDGGRELIEAVREVKQEVAALRRQVNRQSPATLLGGRSA